MADLSQQLQQIVLERIPISCSLMISRAQLENFHITEVADWINNRFTYQLHGYLLGEHLRKEQVTWPADWWEAFKGRWFPTFLLKRWPVKYVGYVFDVKALYPKLNFSLPQEEKYVIFSKLDINDGY